jgi:hypothetical protein
MTLDAGYSAALAWNSDRNVELKDEINISPHKRHWSKKSLNQFQEARDSPKVLHFKWKKYSQPKWFREK